MGHLRRLVGRQESRLLSNLVNPMLCLSSVTHSLWNMHMISGRHNFPDFLSVIQSSEFNL